jgi:nucleoside-diphosphate-sugar epimerase
VGRARYNVGFVKCDIRDFDRVVGCLGDVDLVVHSAIVQIPRTNEERPLGYEVNVLGLQNVCEAVIVVRGRGAFVD